MESSLILIVDDIAKNLQVLGSVLKTEGYRIALAKNGIHALEYAEQNPVDLILLDIMMPEMDGYTTCKKLKENPQTKDIPIIFITALSDADEECLGLDLGAVDYISKPFHPKIVKSRVQTHLTLATQKKFLHTKNQQLEILHKQKNKFLGMAAHDLRNPISLIQMYSAFLLEESIEIDAAEWRKFQKIIWEQTDFMLQLLDDLLDITAIESGKIELRSASWNYLEFLQEVVEINRHPASQKEITLVLEQPGTNISLFFDKNKMLQVMNNLIGNALKYSKQKTKVYLSVFEEHNALVTKITDEGQGIPEDEIADIFDAFHKTTVSVTGGEKSTGLGLAIVKKIIEEHQGSIDVESQVNKGTTFTIRLPK